MRTYSQLVDALVKHSLRRDMQLSIESYVNATIAELHFDAKTGRLVEYPMNLQEASLLIDSEDKFVYRLPKRHLFQSVHAVYAASLGCYVNNKNPSTGLLHEAPFWYLSGDSLVFIDCGLVGAEIKLAYFERPRGLVYYKEGSRPAEWSESLQAYTFTMEEGTALELTTNWILERYPEVVYQGALAKLSARLSKESQRRVAEQVYMGLRITMAATEQMEGQRYAS